MRITVEALRSWCKQEDLRISESKEIPHGIQVVVTDEMTAVPVNVYSTGKVLVQGSPGALKDRISQWMSQQRPAAVRKTSAKQAEMQQPSGPDRIGIDESGKGDYFGPLVVCAAFVKGDDDGWLRELGVKDSKLLTPKKALDLVREIKEVVPHELVVIPPTRYNELDKQIRNLNHLLAWGHARSLESLLARVEATVAISDQFGDRAVLTRALMERGKQVKLIQRHRAEEDAAVAVASIFARAEFLKRMDRMSKEYGMEFPRGASTAVEAMAAEFVKKYGAVRLPEVAKMHFKTTRKVLETLRL
jgi:ribonuclease HIII